MKDLKLLRAQIDWIDQEIIKQLQARLELVESIKGIKLEYELAVYDKAREQEIIKKIKLNTEGKYSDYICEIYNCIMTQAKRLQNE